VKELYGFRLELSAGHVPRVVLDRVEQVDAAADADRDDVRFVEHEIRKGQQMMVEDLERAIDVAVDRVDLRAVASIVRQAADRRRLAMIRGAHSNPAPPRLRARRRPSESIDSIDR